MLLLQEFDIKIRDKKGVENSVADHLIERENDLMPIPNDFPNELHHGLQIYFPPEASRLYKEKIENDAKYYICDDPYLWRLYSDQVIHKCIMDSKIKSVLHFCHSASGGGHYGSTRTTQKVLDCRFYWLIIFGDAHQFVSTCEQCQRARMTISRRHEMPQQPILFYEVFDVWVTKEITSTTELCPPYLKSMGWCTELPQHTTPKQTTKRKYSTGKSRKCCKRWLILAGRTRADSLRTLYGPIGLHTRLH
ncbi:putative mitochondrial protein, partial [Mucuna pruriens]